MTGSNWQPGEVVHIFVNDDWGSSWNRHADVTADPNGNITDQFTLPNWFAAYYSVVATGPTSGIATATFTDANPQSLSVGAPTSVPITQGSTATFGTATLVSEATTTRAQ